MNRGGPERVRVTGPPRRATTRRSRSREIDDQTLLGAVLLRSLMQAQLRLAVLVLLPLIAFGVGVPLAFELVPGLSDVRLGGLPVAWLLLGVLVYPMLVALGWGYVRRAERHEQAFTDLVASSEDP